MKSLQEYFELNPNASLRKLAQATDISYAVLLKKAHEPIANEVYDPNAINWAALEAKLTSKQVDWNTLNWEALNAAPNRAPRTLKKSVEEFNVGDKVYLRRDNITPYEILYKTDTHIVIMKEGTTEPQAWANTTFMFNGPMLEPRATKVEAAVKIDADEVEASANEVEAAPKLEVKSQTTKKARTKKTKED